MQNRRDFLRNMGAATLLPGLMGRDLWAAATQGGPTGKRPPNIVFILTDDQGYGDLGRHDHPCLKTPNIDKLYDESVRFTNFYVSPCCSPTRAALMTGMHEFRNGVTHTIEPREHLNIEATILPQLLKRAGYATAHFGKWHLGNAPGYFAHERGFDLSVRPNDVHTSSNFDAGVTRNGVREEARGFREDILFNEAMQFCTENRDRPFFCYLATFSPHTPLVAPEEFIAPYRGKVRDDIAIFLGMIANIDWNVGRLMAKLAELGIDDNTIVVFMNDNGQTVGLDAYNAGMRGCKCTIWHGGARAMSLWRWPGHWQPRDEGALTAHLDVLPTFTALAGAEAPVDLQPRLEGYSLLPLLAGPDGAFPRDRQLFGHVGRWPNGMADAHKYAMASVRQGSYLLLQSHACTDPNCTPAVQGNQCETLRRVAQGATRATYTEANAQFHWGVSPPGRWVLFDTKQDPACRHDLAAEKPELVARLARDYDRWWESVRPGMINE